jgi:hypothetical protein
VFSVLRNLPFEPVQLVLRVTPGSLTVRRTTEMSPLAVCTRTESISPLLASGLSGRRRGRSVGGAGQGPHVHVDGGAGASTETVTSPDAVVPRTSPRRARSTPMSPDAVRACTEPPVS